MLLNTFTGTKAWVKRSDYQTFGLSNLRTIDTEPSSSRQTTTATTAMTSTLRRQPTPLHSVDILVSVPAVPKQWQTWPMAAHGFARHRLSCVCISVNETQIQNFRCKPCVWIDSIRLTIMSELTSTYLIKNALVLYFPVQAIASVIFMAPALDRFCN